MTDITVPSMAELAAGHFRPLRLIGVARISKLTDASTSMERQEKDIDAYIRNIGGVIVGWARDPDVSASKVPALQRPELGNWLKNRLPEFDGIVVWKLDRIIRSAADLRNLLQHLTLHGKRLYSVQEAVIKFDPTSTDQLAQLMCEIFLTVAGMIAQMEAENIKTRVKSARQYLTDLGYWPAGSAPYGYVIKTGMVEGASKAGKILVKDERAISVINEIIDLVLGRNGQTKAKFDAIARYLTDKPVLPPYQQRRVDRGAEINGSTHWHASTVEDVISNRMLIGEYVVTDVKEENGKKVKKKRVLRGPDGMPIKFVDEPILSRETFAKVEAELASRRMGERAPSAGAQYLSGAILCSGCGKPLYYWKNVTKEKRTHHYYRCGGRMLKGAAERNCPAGGRTLRAALIHDFLDDRIREELAQHELMEDVWVPGTGSHEQLDQVKKSIQEIIRAQGDGQFDDEFAQELFREQLSSLIQRKKKLEAEGVTESHWEERPTGRTLADAWEEADWDLRRELLKQGRITLYAQPGTAEMHVLVGKEAAERMAATFKNMEESK